LPFVSTDLTLTGAGQYDFGAEWYLYYAALHATSLGVAVHEVDPPSTYLYRVGWFSFGDYIAGLMGGDRWYWREPVRIAFNDQLWTPDPSTSGTTSPITLISHGVRWWVSEGTSVDIHIFGSDG
jgi:hypothetical protein